MYRSSAVMTRYAWPNGAIIDFVYSNAKWITVSGSVATTTNYGITRLYSNVNSNSTSVAATASAVKTAYDLAAGKANQSQLAYVETGTTASRAYAVGEYFCWNNLLYRAKTAISSGGTFTPGTNCEQTTVTTQLSKMYAENGEYSVSSGVLRFQGTSPVELGATVVASITRTDSGIWNQYVVYPRILARHDLAFYFRQATDGTNAPNGIYGLSFLIINP